MLASVKATALASLAVAASLAISCSSRPAPADGSRNDGGALTDTGGDGDGARPDAASDSNRPTDTGQPPADGGLDHPSEVNPSATDAAPDSSSDGAPTHVDAPPPDGPVDAAPPMPDAAPPTPDASKDMGGSQSDAGVPPGSVIRLLRTAGNHVNQGRALTVTATGDVVVGGGFAARDTFDPTGLPVTLDSNAGSQDAYIVRYNPAGRVVWLKFPGSTGPNEVVTALAPAPEDGVFLGGTHGLGTDAFILGPGEPSETRYSQFGLFFARYRANGSLVWAKSTGNNGFGSVDRVLGTADGGMIAAGTFSGSAELGMGEANPVTLTQKGTSIGADGFLARFGADGTLSWARSFVADRIDAAQLPDGSTIVIGMFGEAATFTGGTPRTLTPDGWDMFIASYSPAGQLQWAKQIAGPAQATPGGVAVLTSGDFVVTGTLTPLAPAGTTGQGRGTFAPGEANQTTLDSTYFDLFVARYTPAGVLVWAKLAPGASVHDHAIVPSPDGGAVVAAYINTDASGAPRTAVFGPGEPGTISLSQLTARQAPLALAWFRADGTARAARIVVNPYAALVIDFTALPDGTLLATGGFSGKTTFGPLDPAPVTYTGPTSTHENILSMDMFMATFSPL